MTHRTGDQPDPDPQDFSENQATFPPAPPLAEEEAFARQAKANQWMEQPPRRVILAKDKDRREAIDMVLNDEASDTMRIAAFRSLPMDTARLLLDELGVSNLKEYLIGQKSYFDETKPGPWDAEVQHKAAERAQYAARRKEYDAQLGAITANEPKIPQPQSQAPAIDWLKEAEELARQRPEWLKALKNGERKMKNTHINEAGDARRPLAVVLDEYGDLLADLSSQIDRLEDRLRPVLRVDEDPTAKSTEQRDSCDAPAVSYTREHNTRLVEQIDALTGIIDRLEC